MKAIKLFMGVSMLFFAFNLNAQTNSGLNKVLSDYITLKDALVKSDALNASTSAKALLTSIEAVNMSEMTAASHTQWMKVLNDLKEDAAHINETKELTHQRDHFMSLSKNLYTVFKVSNLGVPVYYQLCPMANKGKGANWMSLDVKINNPYYGNQMLNCGKVLDTLQ
jgi:hypothetical protein